MTHVECTHSNDSSFSNLSFINRQENKQSDDSLGEDDLPSKNAPLLDSVESNLDIALTDDEIHSDRNFYRRESRNDDSSEEFFSPDMRPIGGTDMTVGHVRILDPNEQIGNASVFSALTSNEASLIDDANVDVDIEAVSDDNFTVDERMFHKTAVKDSAKLIEQLRIDNFNLKLRIYYFEQDSSLTDKDLRIQQAGNEALDYVLGSSSASRKNVNLHLERDQIREKLTEKERLLDDAKKVIGTFSKDDSMLRDEKASNDREMSKLKQNYEFSISNLKRELGRKDDEIDKLRNKFVSNSVHSPIESRTPPSSLSRSGEKLCYKCNSRATFTSPDRRLNIEALESKLDKATKELESKSKELEMKTRIMSAYEEKLARIEAEHMSHSDTEAAARVSISAESQLRTVTEERDQLKRSVRSKERDLASAMDQVQQLHKQMADKHEQVQQLQSDLRRSQTQMEEKENVVESGRVKLDRALRDKADLEEKIVGLESAMKDGVNHSEEVRELQSQLDELNLNMKCKSVELENCRKEKEKLELQLETSEAKLRENNYERKKVAEELATLQKNVEDADKKSSEQKYSINSLLKENSKAAMEKEDLKEQIQDLKNDLERSSRSVNELEAKNRQLMQEKGSQGENLDKIKKEVKNMQTKLQQLEVQNEQKDSQLKDVEKKLKDLKEKLSEEEDLNSSLRSENSKLKSTESEKEQFLDKIYGLEKDLNRTNDMLNEREKDVEDLKSAKESLGRSLNKLETENSVLKLELDKRSEEIKCFKERVDDYQDKLAQLDSEVKAKKDLLMQANKDLGNKEHVINSSLTELSCLRTQVDSLKSQLLSANRRIEELENSKLEFGSLIEEKEKELKDVKLKSQQDSDNVDKRLEENNRELQFAYQKAAQLEKSEKENRANVERMKFDMEDREKSLRQENGQIEKQLKSVKDDNSKLRKEVENLISSNSSKADIIDGLKSKQQDIEKELAKNSDHMANEIKGLDSTNDNLKRQLKALENSMFSKENEIANLLGKINEQGEIIDHLEKVKSELESENSKLKSGMKELENEKSSHVGYIKELESDIMKIKDTISQHGYGKLELEHDNKKLRSLLKDVEDENSELKSKIDELRSELEESKILIDKEKKNGIKPQSSNDLQRPAFRREKTLYPMSSGEKLANTSLFDNYHTTSDELKKLLVESNNDLELSRQKVNDLEAEVSRLKQQILKSENIFDDMQSKLEVEKKRNIDLKSSIEADSAKQASKNNSSVMFEEFSQTDGGEINDYSQLYQHLSRLAAVSSGENQYGTEASLADILALVEKITQKLQKYKSENKAKEKQVSSLKAKIEELVRLNDSSCNLSETASTVSGFDVQYSNKQFANEYQAKHKQLYTEDQVDGNACPVCGRSDSKKDQVEGPSKKKSEEEEEFRKKNLKKTETFSSKKNEKEKESISDEYLKRMKQELRSKNEELASVKLQFEQYKISATQKRADLSETVAQLNFTVGNLQRQMESMQSQAVEQTRNDDLDQWNKEEKMNGRSEERKEKQSEKDYKKIVEDLEKMLKKQEVDGKKKDAVIQSLEEGCKDMETTFTSTVTSLQDLLQTKDKAVQGLCDQMTRLKDQNSTLKRQLSKLNKMKAETKEKANSVASSENSADEQKISSGNEEELKNVNELLQASQEELETKMKAMQSEHENQCRDLYDKLVEAEQSVEKLSSVLTTRQKELNQLSSENSKRRFGYRYRERVEALEQQMKSTSNTIDSVLQQQSSPGSSSSEDRDHRGYTTGCGKTSVTRSKHAGVQVNKSNVRDQYEISSQTHSEGKDVVTQTDMRHQRKSSREAANEDQFDENDSDEPVIKQLDNYRLQLLSAEADYKLLNDKFIAMKSVLSLQAEKIRAQRQLLKSTVASQPSQEPTGVDEGGNVSQRSKQSSSKNPHRMDSFELGHEKKQPVPRSSVSPPRMKEKKGAAMDNRTLEQKDNLRVTGTSSSAIGRNPLAKSNNSEHDTSRHSLSREGTRQDLLHHQQGQGGPQSKSSSLLELRSNVPLISTSKQASGTNASNPSEESEESDERWDGEGTQPFEVHEESESDQQASGAEDVPPRSPKYDTDNMHMPNIGDLMFEVQRLSKLMKSHDSNTVKMLKQISSKKGHEGTQSMTRDDKRSGSNLLVNTSTIGVDQHTPPTKDTDFTLNWNKESDGKDAMRELMRLSLTSGVLSTHQYLIARIQTQFSRDTNVIDSLKTDLKKQVDETEELKHCLSHLTLASKRLEECLEQSLQIVQCIVSDSQPERPPDTKYSELKKSLAHLNNQKSILTSFHSNPSSGVSIDVSQASRNLLDQLMKEQEEINPHRYSSKRSDDPELQIEYMCEQNRPKMTALMNDNKRLVEILERKDAEIDYLLRTRRGNTSGANSNQVPSTRSQDSIRYESEHQRDASERVCMLTDKLTKLLDENKQLKQCVRGLDRSETLCKGGNLVQTGGSGYDCGVVVGTTFTLFHQLRDQISDARILAKTASVRLKDRLDCGPTNSFSHLNSSSNSTADIPLLGSLARDVSSVAKILEVCQDFLLKFKRVYFDQMSSSIQMSSYTGVTAAATTGHHTSDSVNKLQNHSRSALLTDSANERTAIHSGNGAVPGTMSHRRDMLNGHLLFSAAKNKLKANNNGRLSSHYSSSYVK
ncbi:major antigen-like isoform X4 [Symsagittifera roscoffensis]|uniref:major antigen-like isoform X4 n=1 Tax=Symsagittifera roscoffensis TaxID=84072 RepID=UPI00307CB3C4